MKKKILFLMILFVVSFIVAIAQQDTVKKFNPLLKNAVKPILPKGNNLPVLTTIQARQWQTAINLLLVTLKIKINNFTPTSFQDTSSNTFRWYKKNDCLFQIGMRGQEVVSRFTLLPFRSDPMTIYISNLNKNKAFASAVDRKIKIRIEFEETDMEVRTNCVENLICGGTGNPNFNLIKPAIEIFIEPIITNGKLSYKNAKINLVGALNHEGFNMTVGVMQEIAKLFSFDVNGYIQKEGSRFMESYLNHPAVISDITEKLNMNLDRARASGFSFPANMRSVSIDAAGNIVIYTGTN